MEERYCQSCGMPMGGTDEMYGTEKDGSKSADYCKYCYENGDFTFHGSMEEIIEICVPPMVGHNLGTTPDAAREMMFKFFPMLIRWSTK
jgi:hypothetical protein